MLEAVILALMSDTVRAIGADAFSRLVERVQTSRKHVAGAEELAQYLARRDPEAAADVLRSLSPEQAAATLALVQGVSEKLEGHVPSGDDVIDEAAEELSNLGGLRVSPEIRKAYEATLAVAYPWADSETLEAAALWCALRDTVEEDEGNEIDSLRRDSELLDDIFGRAPAMKIAIDGRAQ